MKKSFTPIELITTLFIIVVIGFGIFVLIKYGNTPLAEIPVWVWFLMESQINTCRQFNLTVK